METYSPRSIVRLTPLRMCVRASPVPSERWTFCARRIGATTSPRTGVRGCDWSCDWSSVSPTDHLHRIVLRGAARGVHRRDQRDHHRADERVDVLAPVLAH